MAAARAGLSVSSGRSASVRLRPARSGTGHSYSSRPAVDDQHFQDVRREELEDFTRETGMVVKLLPCPESAWEQLALGRRMLASGAAGADVYGLDVIWPALLNDSLIDLVRSSGKTSRRTPGGARQLHCR